MMSKTNNHNIASSSSSEAEGDWSLHDQPPSYDESQVQLTPSEEAELSQAMRWVPPQPTEAEANAPRLRKPVVIPRIDVGSPLDAPLPFVRAYSPDLQPHGISKDDFMKFLDNLSIAGAAPMPLVALSLAGDAVGFM
jgi:hypothetical protein